LERSVIAVDRVSAADSKQTSRRQMVNDACDFGCSDVQLGLDKEGMIVYTRLEVLSEAELPEWW
jgi:hypothetical protein